MCSSAVLSSDLQNVLSADNPVIAFRTITLKHIVQLWTMCLIFSKGGLIMLSLCGIIIGFISSICSVDLFIFSCCAYAFLSLVSLAMHFVSGKRVIYK